MTNVEEMTVEELAREMSNRVSSMMLFWLPKPEDREPGSAWCSGVELRTAEDWYSGFCHLEKVQYRLMKDHLEEDKKFNG